MSRLQSPKYPQGDLCSLLQSTISESVFSKILIFPDSVAKAQTYAATDLSMRRFFFSLEDQEQLWAGRPTSALFTIPSLLPSKLLPEK